MTTAVETVRRTVRRPRWETIDTVAAVFVTMAGMALIVLVLIGDQPLDYGFMSRFVWKLLRAAMLSVYATAIAFVVGILIGFSTGWAKSARIAPVSKILRDYRTARKIEPGPPGVPELFLILTLMLTGIKYAFRRLADGFVELMRGTPLFVQIIFVWSVLLVVYPESAVLQTIGNALILPFSDQHALEFLAAMIALTMNTGAYQSEIFRAGLQAVHAGQVEAARALGLSRWAAMRYVVFPQALRLIVPPLTNEFIGLFKASSLLSLLGIAEIVIVGRREAILAHIFEVFALVTGIYLLITVSLSFVVRYLERRYRIPGLGIQKVRSA